jgi:hypothetical protein
MGPPGNGVGAEVQLGAWRSEAEANEAGIVLGSAQESFWTALRLTS